MPLTWNHTPKQSVLIHGLEDGDLELIDRVPTEAATGWDSMRDRYLFRKDSAALDPHAACVAAEVPARGTQVAGKTMWVQQRQGRCRGQGLFEIEVTSMGLLSPRGHKVRYGAGANIQTGENISVPGVGVVARASGRESQVTCDVEYIVTAGATPASSNFYTKAVGSAVAPPSGWEPSVKDSIWAFLNDFTYWYPNGWILDGSEIENLPGLNTVWLIKDRYQYQYEISA